MVISEVRVDLLKVPLKEPYFAAGKQITNCRHRFAGPQHIPEESPILHARIVNHIGQGIECPSAHSFLVKGSMKQLLGLPSIGGWEGATGSQAA